MEFVSAKQDLLVSFPDTQYTQRPINTHVYMAHLESNLTALRKIKDAQ